MLSDFAKVFERKADAYKYLICIMQRVHFQVRVGVFNCQQILAKISFVIFDIVIKRKQSEYGLAWHWWNSTDLGLIDMFLINLIAEIVASMLPQAKSGKYFQIWFFPRFGGKNGVVLSMCMQVILDSPFARPGWAPIYGAGRKESSGTGLCSAKMERVKEGGGEGEENAWLHSPPPPPYFILGSLPISRAGKTPKTPKPHRNACYAG